MVILLFKVVIVLFCSTNSASQQLVDADQGLHYSNLSLALTWRACSLTAALAWDDLECQLDTARPG